MANADQSPLSALAALLSSGVQSLEAAYAKQGGSFPSLDAPFAPTAIDEDPELINLSRIVVAAASQIIAIVRSPMETVQESATASYAAAALNVAVDGHVANILKDSGDTGIHTSEIAAQAGIPADPLARLLRYLATRHIFREVKPDTFANNRISSVLIKSHSLAEIKANPSIEYVGSPVAAAVGHTTDEGMRGAAYIAEWVRSGHKDYPAPFNMGNGVQTDLFHWFESEEYRGRRFHVAAAIVNERWPASIFVDGYDWKTLKKDSVIVDVGASVGSVTLFVLKAYPQFRYVVQDLEKVIKYDAPKYWDAQMPSAVSEGRVLLQKMDFFKSQPVRGAAVYFMRCILHDWSEDKAVLIMKGIREAAGPTSKLILFEAIMPYACAYDGPFAESVNPWKAPYPLLANLGMGLGGFATWMDIQMLNLFNGKERTVGEFIALGKQSGWKLESVKPGILATLVFSPV